jgi:hypothetical protein
MDASKLCLGVQQKMAEVEEELAKGETPCFDEPPPGFDMRAAWEQAKREKRKEK